MFFRKPKDGLITRKEIDVIWKSLKEGLSVEYTKTHGDLSFSITYINSVKIEITKKDVIKYSVKYGDSSFTRDHLVVAVNLYNEYIQ